MKTTAYIKGIIAATLHRGIVTNSFTKGGRGHAAFDAGYWLVLRHY